MFISVVDVDPPVVNVDDMSIVVDVGSIDVVLKSVV